MWILIRLKGRHHNSKTCLPTQTQAAHSPITALLDLAEKHVACECTWSCPDKHSQVLLHTLKQWFLIAQYHNSILLSDAPQLLSPHSQQYQRARLPPLSALTPAQNPNPRARVISATGAKNLTWTDTPLLLLCVLAPQRIFKESSCSSEIYSTY